MSQRRSDVLRVLAWPYRRSDNTYTNDLYDAMIDGARGQVEVEEFRFADAWRQRPDVVHVHWPEAAVESPSVIRAAVKSATLISTLHLLRRRGATIVWTVHNLHSHEAHHPRIETALRDRFFGLVDGVIHLSPGSVDDVARVVPSLGGRPTAVVRHAVDRGEQRRDPSRAAARAALGLEADDLVLLAAGAIRPYKEVPTLIRAFVDAELQSSSLVVAGRPSSAGLANEIEKLARDSPAVHLALGWMSDAAFAGYLVAADVVLCCYAELHNSGMAISALARNRPVLCRRSSATEDLQELVGQEWVALVDGPLTSNSLQRNEPWMRAARPQPPDLRELEPLAIARATFEAYKAFLRPASLVDPA